MKKIYFIILALLPFISNSQIIDFPDENLKQELLNEQSPSIDTNNDGEIDVAEANVYGIGGAENIELSQNSGIITDLTGLENFINIRDLRIYEHGYNNIDLSNFTQLTQLSLHPSNIIELDLSNNPLLEILYLNTPLVTNLDLSNNPLLFSLSLRNLNIDDFNNIDLSNNSNIIGLDLIEMNIDTINIDHLVNLYVLTINDTNLVNLDLSNFNDLWLLDCKRNKLETLLLPSQSLEFINCQNNLLTELIVNNETTDQVEISCENNLLQSLIINTPNVINGSQRLKCFNNQLTSLDLTNTSVSFIQCQNNPLLETINLRNDSNWKMELLLGASNFNDLPLLNTVCLDISSNSILKDYILDQVGHDVDIYNNETCDDFVLNANEFDEVSQFVVYPVPASDTFTVTSKKAIKNITLYNPAGTVVLDENYTDVITINQLKAGVYFAHITDDEGYAEVVQIIKK